jgi:hypothetical protein
MKGLFVFISCMILWLVLRVYNDKQYCKEDGMLFLEGIAMIIGFGGFVYWLTTL